MTAREWLRINGYEDVAEQIDEVMALVAAAGSKERRDWWTVLAGTKTGQPSTIHGRVFPVLRVARIRQGLEPTSNALCRNLNECPPPVRVTGRWKRRRSKARGTKKK